MTLVSNLGVGVRPLASGVPSAPTINLAVKQMCMDAQRMVYQLMADGVRADVAMPLLRYGHCWCTQLTHNETAHRVCCKCGDRYAVQGTD